jgi:hypothetical protein
MFVLLFWAVPLGFAFVPYPNELCRWMYAWTLVVLPVFGIILSGIGAARTGYVVYGAAALGGLLELLFLWFAIQVG